MVTILRHGKRPDVRWFVRIDGELTEVMRLTKPSYRVGEPTVMVATPTVGTIRVMARDLIRA